jgi:thiol-disulfide isomerase/thioredoxin
MLPFVLFLMAFHQNQTTPASPLIGNWVNQNLSTNGITEVVINNNEGGQLKVHVWAKCEPMDCDWGVTDISPSTGLASSVFDAGFARTTIEFIPLPDERLLLVYKSEYKDRSGYREPDQVEFFVREKQSAQDSESIAAKALLKKVAETYRGLSAAQFEAEQFVESINKQSSREKTLSKIIISKPGKERVETTGAGEPQVIISDGETLWTFFPESNEYSVLHAGKLGLAYVGDYTLLGQVREPARIIGSDRVADTDCTMVSLNRNDNHTRTIWIDPRTNFIRKDERKDISPTSEGKYSRASVTTFSVPRTLDNLDPTIFSFDPSKTHAKDRQELQKAAPVATIGTLAPEFILHNLEGKEVRLRDLRGKVVILDFWATWCPPCRAGMPALELLHRQFKDKGLVVLGIDDEDAVDQNAFLRKFDYSFTSLVDLQKKTNNLYSVGGIPTTVIIDGQGKINTYLVGESSYESLWAALQDLGIP